jgi:hypothetical protein
VTAGGWSPTGVARAVLAAIAEGRVSDVLALVDRQVVWMPVTRPALNVYVGHAGMARMVADLQAGYGRFRLDVADTGMGVQAGAGGEVRVTMRVWVVRETAGGDLAGPSVLAEFTVRGGLVSWVESRYEG